MPPPGDLPNPGIKPAFPVSPALQVDSVCTEPPGKPHRMLQSDNNQERSNMHGGDPIFMKRGCPNLQESEATKTLIAILAPMLCRL